MKEQTIPTRCAIEEALSIIGDRWSLLVVRDVLLGIDRFDSLQQSLNISRNILTQRLLSLEEAGLLSKTPIKPGARRMCYRATPKCMALTPVLIAMIEWGANWSDKEGVKWARVIEKATGNPVGVHIVNSDGMALDISSLSLKF